MANFYDPSVKGCLKPPGDKFISSFRSWNLGLFGPSWLFIYPINYVTRVSSEESKRQISIRMTATAEREIQSACVFGMVKLVGDGRCRKQPFQQKLQGLQMEINSAFDTLRYSNDHLKRLRSATFIQEWWKTTLSNQYLKKYATVGPTLRGFLNIAKQKRSKMRRHASADILHHFLVEVSKITSVTKQLFKFRSRVTFVQVFPINELILA